MGRTEDVAVGFIVCTRPAFSISRATIVVVVVTMMTAHGTQHLPQTGSCLAPFHTLFAFDPAIATAQVLCPQGGAQRR